MKTTQIHIPILRSLLAVCSMMVSTMLQAQDDDFGNYQFEQNFYFKLDKYDINEDLDNNRATVDSMLHKVHRLKVLKAADITIHVTGSASLEASEDYNYRLAARRTDAIIGHLRRFKVMEGVQMHPHYGLYDWSVLYAKVSQVDCPDRDALLDIIRQAMNHANTADCKAKIRSLSGGQTYRFIEQHFFHYMRYCHIVLSAKVPLEKPEPAEPEPTTAPPAKKKAGFPPVALRTNLLYDAATFLNIGADIYVSDNISLGASWMYSWWKTDKKHIYMRGYGGDIHADYWFDSTLKWSGHHMGIYGQMGTYDIEWRHKGYLMPKWLFGGGLSYGYSHWLSNRFRLDTSIGIGYVAGDLKKYDPNYDNRKNYTSLDGKTIYNDGDRHTYFLDKSKDLRWFGPTKLEISLIWVLNK